LGKNAKLILRREGPAAGTVRQFGRRSQRCRHNRRPSAFVCAGTAGCVSLWVNHGHVRGDPSAPSSLNSRGVGVSASLARRAKQLTAALQAEMIPAQVTMMGERRRSCEACGGVLAGKGHYSATFRSLFGDVPVRVRRRLACPCQGSGGAKSFAVLDLEAATVAPELAYVTARYAALAPFGKVAALLSELL